MPWRTCSGRCNCAGCSVTPPSRSPESCLRHRSMHCRRTVRRSCRATRRVRTWRRRPAWPNSMCRQPGPRSQMFWWRGCRCEQRSTSRPALPVCVIPISTIPAQDFPNRAASVHCLAWPRMISHAKWPRPLPAAGESGPLMRRRRPPSARPRRAPYASTSAATGRTASSVGPPAPGSPNCSAVSCSALRSSAARMS